MNNRKISTEHEDYIAKLYDGRRSPSSGASIKDKCDVIGRSSLYECKSKGRVGGKPISSTALKHMEKIADSAWEVGKMPVLCERIFSPDSPLADSDGYVYLSTRLSRDDAWLEGLARESSLLDN